MPKSQSRKKKPPKRVLALPDLEHSKMGVLNSLTSASGQRTYDHALREFVAWYCSEPRLAFNRTVVLRYRIHLEQKRAGSPADGDLPLINLGGVLQLQGKYSAAIEVLRESVDVTTRNLGSEHSHTLEAMNNLGRALSLAGQFAEAERVQREVLNTRTKLLGNTHFDVAMARYNLGNTLHELARFDEAAQMLRESVAVYRSTFRGPHFQTAWALTDLGSVEYERGQLDEAERLQREAAAMFQTPDPNSSFVGKPWYGLGEIFYRRGERAEAEKYFRMDLDLLKKDPHTSPTSLAWPETAVGRLLTERGRPDEAEPLLRHALASLRADLPPPEQLADGLRRRLARGLFGVAPSIRGSGAVAARRLCDLARETRRRSRGNAIRSHSAGYALRGLEQA